MPRICATSASDALERRVHDLPRDLRVHIIRQLDYVKYREHCAAAGLCECIPRLNHRVGPGPAQGQEPCVQCGVFKCGRCRELDGRVCQDCGGQVLCEGCAQTCVTCGDAFCIKCIKERGMEASCDQCGYSPVWECGYCDDLSWLTHCEVRYNCDGARCCSRDGCMVDCNACGKQCCLDCGDVCEHCDEFCCMECLA